MRHLILLLSLVLVVFNSCSKDEETTNLPNCDSISEIITENDFNNIEVTNYSISSVSLNGDCLELTISSSGCDPELWEMEMFSTNAFYNIFPLQRAVKVKLINNQECLAVFQKTKSFNLTPFRIEGQNSVPLNIEGWNEQIIYEY